MVFTSLMICSTTHGMKRTLEICPIFLQAAEDQWFHENYLEQVITKQRKIEPTVVPKIERKHAAISYEKHQGRYSCGKCLFSTTHQIRLASHSRMHNIMKNNPSKRVYCCSVCAFLTDNKKVFSGHAVSHQDEKTFQCAVKGCTAKTKSERSLQRHTKLVHNNIQ